MLKKCLLPVLLLLGAAGAAHAQAYRTHEFHQCVRQFYDPQMYNWLSYKNTCGESITIHFIPAAGEASIYVLMFLVLLVRPRGLLGERIEKFE